MIPEMFRSVVGFPLYEVSNYGNFRTWKPHQKQTKKKRDFPKRLKMKKSGNGYYHYCFQQDGKTRMKRVHILVLETFVGNRPEGYQGCHNDGNPANNHIDNLRWDVYAYIYPKHPIFDEIESDNLFLEHNITGQFHWGLSYHEWNYDKEGAVYSKKLGSDYSHLHDTYERICDINLTPTERDAENLFEYLTNVKVQIKEPK